jgi:lactoylglutathione lyase
MKFGYTTFFVHDVEATLSFYEKVFHLETRFLHESKCYGELDTGTTTLSFATYELVKENFANLEILSSKTSAHPFQISFVTEDVAKAYEHAINSGAESILVPIKKPWGQTIALVKDLNSFTIEICSKIKS